MSIAAPYDLRHGDCREVMVSMDAESIDAIVSDPPYGLGFMGKEWDHGVPGEPFWAEALRVAKPGAHLVAFGGPRTFHRLTCAVEDAGWEIRDVLMWVYGSGMPKGWNFNNRVDAEEWCNCRGNAAPYDHGEQTTERELRPVRLADVPASEHDEDKRGQVLLQGVPEQGTPTQGELDAQTGNARGSQPRMEGRGLHRTGQGLQDGAQPDASASTAERIRAGAHPGCGGVHGASASAGGGSAPHQRGPRRQPAGKSEGVRVSSGALDGRALRNGGCCARCGKLSQDFRGFDVALKPAYEPIVLARKPLRGTVARNVQAFGTGAVNVGGCRVGGSKRSPGFTTSLGVVERSGSLSGAKTPRANVDTSVGRWPANVLLDEAAAAVLDAQSGELTSGSRKAGEHGLMGYHGAGAAPMPAVTGDRGGASRFFYTSKASGKDRGREEHGNDHPTVKPTDLMRWLCRLVTPPGGLILDPFMGSGSTGVAAVEEGFRFVGIDIERHHVDIAERRLKHAARQPALFEDAV